MLYLFPDQLDCFPVPIESGPQLSPDSVHVVDGTVHVNRNCRPNVLQHHVTFGRFGFEEGLINKNRHVLPGAKLGQCLGRSGYHVGFFRRDLLNRLGATLSFGGRRND